MRPEQWDTFKRAARLEKLDKVPMALIVDSPWIPGYLGIKHLDYYLDPRLWFESNLKIMREYPDIIFVPSWWMEYGMAAEPSVLGAKIKFWQDNTPSEYHTLYRLEDIAEFPEYEVEADAFAAMTLHRIAMHRSRPNVLFMQKHWDVMRSDDGGDSWREVSGNLPTDFGFPIDVHAHEPETIYVVPIKSDSEHYPPDGKLRVYRSRSGGDEWQALSAGLPQRDCYVNVLRDAMAVDSLDACGVYFGTTGGQVYVSADAGDSWAPIVRDLPPVLSVEVQTLP